jgi:hypothetical protein
MLNPRGAGRSEVVERDGGAARLGGVGEGEERAHRRDPHGSNMQERNYHGPNAQPKGESVICQGRQGVSGLMAERGGDSLRGEARQFGCAGPIGLDPRERMQTEIDFRISMDLKI